MTLRKGDILDWFHQLDAVTRVDFMCSVLQSCNPFEIRLVGTCLEHIARRDYLKLKESELKANNPNELRTVTDEALAGKSSCLSKLVIYMCLMHSRPDTLCVGLLYDLINNLVERTKQTFDTDGAAISDDLLEKLQLLLVIAYHHPAFTYQQNQTFSSHIETLDSCRRPDGPAHDSIDHSSSPLIPSDIPHHTPDQNKCDSPYAVDSLSPLKERVLNLHLLSSEHHRLENAYLIQVTTNSNNTSEQHSHVVIQKTFNEIKMFHHALHSRYPNDAKASKHEQRLPLLKSADNAATVDCYLSELSQLPAKYLCSDVVLNFFLPNDTSISDIDRPSGHQQSLVSSVANANKQSTTASVLQSQHTVAPSGLPHSEVKPDTPHQTYVDAAKGSARPHSSSRYVTSQHSSVSNANSAVSSTSSNLTHDPSSTADSGHVNAASVVVSSRGRRMHHPTQQFYSAQSAHRHSPRHASPVTPTRTAVSSVNPLQQTAAEAATSSSQLQRVAAGNLLPSSIHNFLKSLKLHKYFGTLAGYSLVELSDKTVDDFKQLGLVDGAARKLASELDKAKLKRSLVTTGGATYRDTPATNQMIDGVSGHPVNCNDNLDSGASSTGNGPNSRVTQQQHQELSAPGHTEPAIVAVKHQTVQSRSAELYKKQDSGGRIQRSWSSSHISSSSHSIAADPRSVASCTQSATAVPTTPSQTNTTSSASIDIQVLTDNNSSDDALMPPSANPASPRCNSGPAMKASSQPIHSTAGVSTNVPSSMSPAGSHLSQTSVYVTVEPPLISPQQQAHIRQPLPPLQSKHAGAAAPPSMTSPIMSQPSPAANQRPPRATSQSRSGPRTRAHSNSSGSGVTVEDIQMMQREKKRQQMLQSMTAVGSAAAVPIGSPVYAGRLPINQPPPAVGDPNAYVSRPTKSQSVSGDVESGDLTTDEQTDNDISELSAYDKTGPMVIERSYNTLPASYKLSDKMEGCDLSGSYHHSTQNVVMQPLGPSVVPHQPVTMIPSAHPVTQPNVVMMPTPVIPPPPADVSNAALAVSVSVSQVNSDSDSSYIGQPMPNGYIYQAIPAPANPQDLERYGLPPGIQLTTTCSCPNCLSGFASYPPSHPNGYYFQGYPVPGGGKAVSIAPTSNGLMQGDYAMYTHPQMMHYSSGFPSSQQIHHSGALDYNGHLSMTASYPQNYLIGAPLQERAIMCTNCGSKGHDRSTCQEPVDTSSDINQYRLDVVPQSDAT